MLVMLNPDCDKPFLTGGTIDWKINAFGLYVCDDQGVCRITHKILRFEIQHYVKFVCE